MDDPKHIVRTGYDKAAEAYTRHRRTHVESEVLDLLDELCATAPAGSRLLDAGCGGGVIAAILSEHFDVVGVDLSIEQLRFARTISPRARLVCQDITTLSPPDGSFAAIACLWTIIHIPREEHLGLLEIFARALRPEGLALLSFGRTDWEGSEPFFGAELWWSHFDRDTSLELVERAGFELVRVVDVDDRPSAKRAPFVLARQRNRR